LINGGEDNGAVEGGRRIYPELEKDLVFRKNCGVPKSAGTSLLTILRRPKGKTLKLAQDVKNVLTTGENILKEIGRIQQGVGGLISGCKNAVPGERSSK